MPSAAQALRITMIAGDVAWFGGLFRLIGEAVARVVATMSLTREQQQMAALAILAGLIIFGGEFLLLRRWSWYRGVVQQSQADIRSLYDVRPAETPPSSVASRRLAKQAAVVLIPALLVAAVLPGIIAAVVALVVGLVLRVAAITIAATVT